MLEERRRRIIEKINHPRYTAWFLEAWLKHNDGGNVKAAAPLQDWEANGFYDAVRAIAEREADGKWPIA